MLRCDCLGAHLTARAPSIWRLLSVWKQGCRKLPHSKHRVTPPSCRHLRPALPAARRIAGENAARWKPGRRRKDL